MQHRKRGIISAVFAFLLASFNVYAQIVNIDPCSPSGIELFSERPQPQMPTPANFRTWEVCSKQGSCFAVGEWEFDLTIGFRETPLVLLSKDACFLLDDKHLGAEFSDSFLSPDEQWLWFITRNARANGWAASIYNTETGVLNATVPWYWNQSIDWVDSLLLASRGCGTNCSVVETFMPDGTALASYNAELVKVDLQRDRIVTMHYQGGIRVYEIATGHKVVDTIVADARWPYDIEWVKGVLTTRFTSSNTESKLIQTVIAIE